MNYNALHNKEVSSIGIGTWGLSGDWNQNSPTPESITRILETAYDAGINLIDTAPVYGKGIIEKAIGQLSWRSKAVISTKIPAKIRPNQNPFPYEEYYDPDYIESEVVRSLQKMKLDSIDFVQLHNWSPLWNTHPEFFLSPLQKLKRKGLIRAIGISLPNNFNHDLGNLLDYDGLNFIQVPYNPVERWGEQYVFGQCKERNIYVLVRSLYYQGLISPNLEHANINSSKTNERKDKVYDIKTLQEAVENWINQYGDSWQTINRDILKHVLRLTGNHGSILVGMTKPEHIRKNLLYLS